MPRDILFRGFHKDTLGSKTIIVDGKEVQGEWIEGDYLHEWKFSNSESVDRIYPRAGQLDRYIVIPLTVVQYTGLVDKNGRKIFEGDKATNIGNGVGIVRFGTVSKNLGWNGTNHLAFYVEFDNADLRQDLPYWADKSEVIGTIFDKEVAKCD